MSIQFSDTTNKTGLVELIDDNCHSNNISYPIENKTRDINLALDYTFDLIFSSAGRWQFDDGNHTKLPFITTNLVSGQRDYSFTVDENDNLILDIYKVMVKDENGIYVEIDPVDQQSDEYMQGFWNGQNLTGIPSRYDKTANGIFLDAIPSYNSTNGLKIFINREGSYFTKTDTTKKAGFSGLYHEILALRPSHFYCKRNKMFDLATEYKNDMTDMEKKIQKHYRDRSKDEQLSFSGEQIDCV